MTKAAQAFAKMEGYGVAGSIPTRQNNPGDLRHAPGEAHPADLPDSVGSFATPSEGFFALERQLQLYASRGLTVEESVYEFAPPTENDSEQYLSFVCDELGCSPQTLMVEALKL